MDDSDPPALRGFDSYEVKLGDELRGHRATRGKSLLDVQRDLRIRAAYIDAIENCDPSVIPNAGFVAGYVRAYARYLELDADIVYRRFCAESGFSGRDAAAGRARAAARSGVRAPGGRDATLARSHFAAPVGRARRVGLGVSLSGVASIAVVAGLLGGLGWGGFMLLQEIQRVDFAPVNEAPEIAAAPGGLALPTVSLSALAETPRARDDVDAGRDAALAALYAPAEAAPPALALRDGPIGAIDPDSVGVFADRADQEQEQTTGAAGSAAPTDARVASLEEAVRRVEAAKAGGADQQTAAQTTAQAEPAPAAAARGVWIVTTDPAWLRVQLADGSTLVQKIFQRGDRYELPADLRGARMRAGNAGAVYLEIDGVLHGPLGRPGGVAKEVALSPDAIRARFQIAEAGPGATTAPELRAEAQISLD